MENKEFKWEYTLNLETYKEFSKGYLATNIVRKIFRLILAIYITYYFMICYHTANYAILIFFAIFFAVIFLIAKIVNKGGNIQYKRMLSVNKGQPMRIEVRIDNEGIHAINIDTGNKNDYTFDQIISVIETKNLFILKMKYNMGLIVNKNTLTGGSKEEFINFIFDNCSNVKRKKVKQAKVGVAYRIICIAFVALIIMGASYQYRDRRTYSLYLPEADELTSITLEQNAEGKVISDYEEMDNILDVLNGVKRVSQQESVQDWPVNVENEIVISFYSDRGLSSVFVYKRGWRYYIEQPYNGVYRISEDEYKVIEDYTTN